MVKILWKLLSDISKWKCLVIFHLDEGMCPTLGWRNVSYLWITSLHSQMSPTFRCLLPLDVFYHLDVSYLMEVSYLWVSPTFECLLQLTVSYLWVSPTFECLLPLSVSHIWVSPTFECLKTLNVSYLWISSLGGRRHSKVGDTQR